MLNIKKIASVVAVLVLASGAAYPGSIGPTANIVNATLPAQATWWDFGAKVLYLEPSIDNINSPGTIFSDNRTEHLI